MKQINDSHYNLRGFMWISAVNRKGFSLLEVMVVLVIIGVMAIFAAPELINFGPNARLKAAARDLHTNLQKMKVEAIKRNRNLLISFVNPVVCPAHPSTTVPSPGGSYTINIDVDNDGTVSAGDIPFSMDDNSGDATPDGDYDMPQNTAMCINASLPANSLFKFTSKGLWLDSASAPLAGDSIFQMQNDKGRGYRVTVSIAGGINTSQIP